MADTNIEEEYDPTIEDAVKNLIVGTRTGESGEKIVETAEAPRKETQEQVDTPPAGEEAGQEEPVEESTDEEPVDIDAIELDVMVDGQVRKVPIRELKKSFSFTGAVDKRLQEVTEGRNRVAAQAEQLNNMLGAANQRLQALDSILEEAENDGVDLEEIRYKDPTRYLFEKERRREIQEKRAQVAGEQRAIQQQQQRIQQEALMKYSAEQAYLLGQKDPDFANPETAPKAMAALVQGAAEYGYTPQEVGSVSDHRPFLVLKDALKWRAHVKKLGQAQTQAKIAPKVLMKPMATKPKSSATTEAKRLDSLRALARKTGTVNDVAATLLVRKPRQ